MKKVLIVGKNSYVGNSVIEWLVADSSYYVDCVDTLSDEWQKKDFSDFECIFLVAGIVHKKNAPEELYNLINCDLALKVLEKSVNSGCKQFIFMSSGAVYSQNDKHNKTILIDKTSICNPSTFYGKSKLNAEIQMQKYKDRIKIAILRPPMIYGYGAKGNYNSLSKIANRSFIIPTIKNQRSMIYIDNFCEFVKCVIDADADGIFLPQNKEYTNTSEIMLLIARTNNHKCFSTKMFNWIINIASHFVSSINKAFGTFIYKKEEFIYFDNRYQIVSLEDSIIQTEKGR